MGRGQFQDCAKLLRFKTAFPSLLLLSFSRPKELNPTLSVGTVFLKSKIVLLLGGEGVVSVKETGCGRQIC